MARRDDLIRHILRLVNLTRSARLKRSLASVESDPTLNFWRLIYGNLLDVAVLEWCKIFGAHAEPTHWKNVVTDHDTFRNDLLASLKIDDARWNAYWEEMKTYRNKLIAHHIEDGGPAYYPKLDLALKSSYYYYAYLIEDLRALGETRFPDDLKEYSERFACQATDIAKKALGATAGIAEKVN